ncbi:MAG: LPS export ABC transporter periplasmic protein LptC [Rhodothermales bacterium]|nr:LPS export ABC transporter periplasmic protein LptC [Rhodothermales bacterium]
MAEQTYIALLAIAAMLGSGLGCSSQSREPVTFEQVQDAIGPRQESWDAELVVSNDGVRRTILRAHIWQEYGKNDSTYSILSSGSDSIKVEAEIFDETGERTAIVKSIEMYFNPGEGHIIASGDVIVRTDTDRILETEKLLWWEEDGRIEAPGFVKLTAPRETIQGYQLDSDEALENYTLGRVTGQILVDE